MRSMTMDSNNIKREVEVKDLGELIKETIPTDIIYLNDNWIMSTSDCVLDLMDKDIKLDIVDYYGSGLSESKPERLEKIFKTFDAFKGITLESFKEDEAQYIKDLFHAIPSRERDTFIDNMNLDKKRIACETWPYAIMSQYVRGTLCEKDLIYLIEKYDGSCSIINEHNITPKIMQALIKFNKPQLMPTGIVSMGSTKQYWKDILKLHNIFIYGLNSTNLTREDITWLIEMYDEGHFRKELDRLVTIITNTYHLEVMDIMYHRHELVETLSKEDMVKLREILLLCPGAFRGINLVDLPKEILLVLKDMGKVYNNKYDSLTEKLEGLEKEMIILKKIESLYDITVASKLKHDDGRDSLSEYIKPIVDSEIESWSEEDKERLKDRLLIDKNKKDNGYDGDQIYVELKQEIMALDENIDSLYMEKVKLYSLKSN